MKMIMHFKDGSSVSNDLGENVQFSGQGNLLQLILEGKKSNGNIEITDSETGKNVSKKYSELYSLEIVFAE